jgi:ABC-type transport system substrate-binding protein
MRYGIQAIIERAQTRRQFLKRSLGAGAALGASSLVLPRIVEAKVEGNTLIVAHVEEVGTLDPKVWGGFAAIYVQTQIYDTLMRQDPVTGELKPSLALSWENPDPLTYRYTLRDDAKFHNGAPVTAEDVAFTFNRIADPAEGAWEQYMFVNVQEAVALDDRTVEVRMKQPDHQFQFIGYFEGGNILNKAHAMELGADIGTCSKLSRTITKESQPSSGSNSATSRMQPPSSLACKAVTFICPTTCRATRP